MKLTIKAFIIELLLNFLIFFILNCLFVLIFTNSKFLQAIPEFFSLLPLILSWLCFTILIFHKVFLEIFSKLNYYLAIKNFLILLVSIFIIDLFYLNILNYMRGSSDKVFYYSNSFWMRFALFFTYAIAYSFLRGISYLREQRAMLQKENAESQLRQLQSQIEPHLIFNTLNSIYALSLEEKAERTSLCIEELSALFHYSFRQNEMNISVSKELDFIEKYIHLNEIRFGNNESLKISAQIEWDKKPAQIAPMLLISFIENAFKHGIDKDGNSLVNIILSIKDCKLSMLIENTIHQNASLIQKGIGLNNTQKRLKLIYPGKYTLKETAGIDSYKVQLEINLV